MEKMEQQYQQQQPVDVTSPTLEALCHDLDMFINELSTSNNTTSTETTHMKRLNKDITPLVLDKTLVKNKIRFFILCSN
jgi:hypothetical protein